MYLRKEKAGGVGPYMWEHDGAVIEVDDQTGLDLLSIGHAGFSEVIAPVAADDQESDEDSVAVDEPAPAPVRRSRRTVEE